MTAIVLEDQNNLVLTKDYPLAQYPFEKFNPVQSRIIEIYEEDCNIIVAAATSAGKTITSEIVAAHELKKGKIVYLAPMKALAKEKIDDWSKETHQFNKYKLAICTGDYRLTPERKKELESANIIMMTNEMLNSRVRNYTSEHNDWLKDVSLIINDEFHILGTTRGPHTEVGLMKFTEINNKARIIGLSATMPNVDEISNWVETLNNKKTYLIDSQYRPCPLGIHWETYFDKGSYSQVEGYKAEAAVDLVQLFPKDKFILFVHSKNTGELLLKALKAADIECAFHNADQEKDSREKIENEFKNGNKLRVIVATSTLAWGCYKYGSQIAMKDGSLKSVEKLSIGEEVYSLSKNSFVSNKINRIETKKVKTSIKVGLATGEETTVTIDHLFLGAIGRNSPSWIRSDQLSIGDFIAIPQKFNNPAYYDFDLHSYLIGAIMGDGCIVDCGPHADGTQKGLLDVACDNLDEDYIDFIAKKIQELSGFEVSSPRSDSNGVLHFVCKSKKVVDLFLPYVPMGRKGNKLKIDDRFFKDRNKLASLLCGLCDTDGGISSHSNGNYSIEFTSISKILVKQVQHAFLLLGIRASVGKKRMKKSIINGRTQLPKRKYIWRVRIYNDEIQNYKIAVGFLHPRKKELLANLIKTGDSSKTDLIPMRDLFLTHALKNNVSVRKMLKSVGVDNWTVFNRQETTRKNCEKIINLYPERSDLNTFLEMPVCWKKVTKLEKLKGGYFKEIEIDKDHNYIGDSIISHNCNLPARRVVIVGVHRGLEEVEQFDIKQECGRSGRVGLDPRGDAYILVPERKADYHIERLSQPAIIKSKLLDFIGGTKEEDSANEIKKDPHYKVLAFHLVSEIHHGDVRTKEDIKKWFARTLAYYQSKDMSESILDSTLNLLKQYGAIKEEEGIFKCTSVGTIASMFYYSPFDTADLRRNFRFLFDNNYHSNDISLSMALGAVDTIKMQYVTKAEQEEMETYKLGVKKMYGDVYTDSAIKGGYAHYALLTGMNPGPFTALSRGIQADFDRTLMVLNALDSMSCNWNKRPWLNTLGIRMMYGVSVELVPLCRLPNIGKVRAERLWGANLRTYESIVNNPEHVGKVLNMKADKVQEIIEEARKKI